MVWEVRNRTSGSHSPGTRAYNCFKKPSGSIWGDAFHGGKRRRLGFPRPPLVLLLLVLRGRVDRANEAEAEGEEHEEAVAADEDASQQPTQRPHVRDDTSRNGTSNSGRMRCLFTMTSLR